MRDTAELFQAPALDPFAGQVSSLSGMDRLAGLLKPRSLARPVRTLILLPADRLSPALEALARDAIRCYCQARIDQIPQELASLRWQGFKALQTGLVFLAVCLLLSTLFSRLQAFPEFLRRFLGEGFLIAGWVSLWHPAELLLYKWWPYWRDKRLHERLRDME